MEETNPIDPELTKRTGQPVRRLRATGLLAVITALLLLSESVEALESLDDAIVSDRVVNLFLEYWQKLETGDKTGARNVLPLIADALSESTTVNPDALYIELERLHEEATKRKPCDPTEDD